MKTIIFEFPFVVITTVVTASFQGYGNTKIPMYIAVLMNVVNIVCGYCFIFGAFGIPGMGIKGAATALLMAQAVGAGTGLYLLYKKKGGLFRKVPSEHRFFSFDKNVSTKSILQEFRQLWKPYSGRFLLSFE